ncbi:HAD family hydrolase [Rubrimonas sp.]|uniref:HAD family hydrolase n=1 Tax=Rubrimonas sp. TaxID=2036015 RepID=UPI002FDC890A
MAVRAMVFDIGRVLFDWRPERLYAELIPDAAERERFFTQLCPPEWNLAFDAGRDMPRGVEEDAAKAADPRDASLIRAWWTRWPDMVGPQFEGSVACFRALKARGVPVYGLTNFAAETYPIAEEMFPILREFDLCVVSGREGCVKPQPRIYEILEQRTGHAPRELFFADDSAPNVAAARARGWTAHLFEGAPGLARALGEVGLLPADQAAALEGAG